MKHNLLFIIMVAIYRVLLDYIYRLQITPFFKYWLMVDNSTISSYAISWFILAAFCIATLQFYNKIPEYRNTMLYVVLFIFLVKLVPFTSFLYYQPQSTSFIAQQLILWTLLYVLLYYGKGFRFSFIKKSDSIVGMVTIIVSAAVIIVSGVYAGFRLRLSLANVYDLRMEAREFNMPILLKYIYSFAANIIPICMVYYITRKKKYMIYLLAFIGLLNFSIAGSKSTLFRILLCVGLLYLSKVNYKKWLIPSFLVICIFSVLEFYIYESTSISTILIRRSFYIPNLLDSVYFDYLQNMDPFFFDTSKFTDIQFRIGGDVFGNEQMRANNGFFTDAYINLGAAGCVVYPFIYSIIFRALEGACYGLNQCVSVFCAFLVVATLESTFFTTSLLTHGIFLMIVTLYFMPIHGEDSHYKSESSI